MEHRPLASASNLSELRTAHRPPLTLDDIYARSPNGGLLRAEGRALTGPNTPHPTATRPTTTRTGVGVR